MGLLKLQTNLEGHQVSLTSLIPQLDFADVLKIQTNLEGHQVSLTSLNPNLEIALVPTWVLNIPVQLPTTMK